MFLATAKRKCPTSLLEKTRTPVDRGDGGDSVEVVG